MASSVSLSISRGGGPTAVTFVAVTPASISLEGLPDGAETVCLAQDGSLVPAPEDELFLFLLPRIDSFAASFAADWTAGFDA